jgi:hypothetical protein
MADTGAYFSNVLNVMRDQCPGLKNNDSKAN